MNRYETALNRAIDVLGDKDKALMWLVKMNSEFGKTPKEALSEQDGLNRVLRHLRSVELALGRD